MFHIVVVDLSTFGNPGLALEKLQCILFKKRTFESIFMLESNTVICLLSPEISLKSAKVKDRLECIAKENIIKYLKANKVKPTNIFMRSARIFIETNETKKVIKVLKNCFGIFALIEAQKTDSVELEELKKIAIEIGKDKIKGTFAMRAKSHNKKFKSKELEIEIGGAIVEEFSVKVNLSAPQTQLNILLFDKNAFYYFDSACGAKGMPVGAQGTVALIGKDKSTSEKIAKKLLKCGCRVKLIADFDLDLKEFNSMEEIKKVSLEELEKLRKNDKIKAVFSDSTNLEEKEKIDDLLKEKTFAPLICLI
jgi:adenylyl- and sulfurtransferase ThiI